MSDGDRPLFRQGQQVTSTKTQLNYIFGRHEGDFSRVHNNPDDSVGCLIPTDQLVPTMRVIHTPEVTQCVYGRMRVTISNETVLEALEWWLKEHVFKSGAGDFSVTQLEKDVTRELGYPDPITKWNVDCAFQPYDVVGKVLKA